MARAGTGVATVIPIRFAFTPNSLLNFAGSCITASHPWSKRVVNKNPNPIQWYYIAQSSFKDHAKTWWCTRCLQKHGKTSVDRRCPLPVSRFFTISNKTNYPYSSEKSHTLNENKSKLVKYLSTNFRNVDVIQCEVDTG